MWGTPFWRNERLRTIQRALGVEYGRLTRRRIRASKHGVQTKLGRRAAEHAGGRLLQQAFSGGVHQPQRVLGIESEDRHIDLVDHAAQQRGRFDGLNALLGENVGEGVDFQRQLAERVIGIGLAGAKRVVLFAQRAHHVGQSLQRTDDLLQQRKRKNEPQRRTQGW